MRIARLSALLLAGACASAPRTATVPASTSAVSSTPASRTSLTRYVDSLIDAPDFRSANWGILIVDPGRGETLYSRNADKLFMPASNMKIVTGSTALTQLGANFRWSTTVLARGTVRDSVLA